MCISWRLHISWLAELYHIVTLWYARNHETSKPARSQWSLAPAYVLKNADIHRRIFVCNSDTPLDYSDPWTSRKQSKNWIRTLLIWPDEIRFCNLLNHLAIKILRPLHAPRWSLNSPFHTNRYIVHNVFMPRPVIYIWFSPRTNHKRTRRSDFLNAWNSSDIYIRIFTATIIAKDSQQVFWCVSYKYLH